MRCVFLSQRFAPLHYTLFYFIYIVNILFLLHSIMIFKGLRWCFSCILVDFYSSNVHVSAWCSEKLSVTGVLSRNSSPIPRTTDCDYRSGWKIFRAAMSSKWTDMGQQMWCHHGPWFQLNLQFKSLSYSHGIFGCWAAYLVPQWSNNVQQPCTTKTVIIYKKNNIYWFVLL